MPKRSKCYLPANSTFAATAFFGPYFNWDGIFRLFHDEFFWMTSPRVWEHFIAQE